MIPTPINVLGGLAAAQQAHLAAAESDRAKQQAAAQTRAADSSQRAEKASGIGETEPEEAISDRDADGRRLWERPAKKPVAPNAHEPAADPAAASEPSLPADPLGECGGQLDILG